MGTIETAPVIWWVRRDMRLTDNPALSAACATGRPVIPVFLHDEVVAGMGAMPRWRMLLGAAHLGRRLEDRGSALILRRGPALDTLRELARATGAGAVYWSRLVDPDAKARDTAVKTALRGDGIDAKSFAGHLLFDPWSVETKTGGFYRVYTPYWRAVKDRDVGAVLPVPDRIPAPDRWPAGDVLDDWKPAAGMDRGADIVAPYLAIGEDAAQGRLGAFLSDKVADYDRARDIPGVSGTSRLSENLTLGEISPRTCWLAGLDALHAGKDGAETFLKELVWREFAHHLAHHTPHLTARNWREEWDAFPWNEDESRDEVVAWKRGRTGIRFVDAAMRELYVTGYMHNRARMIAGSYLCKHLMTDWRVGQRWFEQTLRDWDPASNAMGWQWVAGSGADATPYFRVFNPVTQLDKFDRDRAYTDGWIAEGRANPTRQALAYFEAIPRAWGLSPDDPYPDPLVTAEAGRQRALDAYENRSF